MIQSFPPIADRNARILILGSMPGDRSLNEGQYYAHPQNAFWYIMGELFGAGWSQDYAARCDQLQQVGIAVWDVLQSCKREGSLDAAIERKSMIPNDFATFLCVHPGISHIFFNGGKAADVFLREVAPTLSDSGRALQFERLPSTSPAHAALSRQQKLAAWRKLCDVLPL